jgi:hypothetical protein
MVEQQLPKLNTRVRFPSPAPSPFDNLAADLFWSLIIVATFGSDLVSLWPLRESCGLASLLPELLFGDAR